MKEPIVLIGGGGHAQSVIEILESQAKYELLYIWDLSLSADEVLGYQVNKDINNLAEIIAECRRIVIAVGQVKDPSNRIGLFDKLKREGAILPNIISPHALVSRHAKLGEGNVIMHSALINASAHVGNNCIINSGATIEHGVKVGDHTHISTHAIINGNCSVGLGTFVGSNAIVREGVIIAEKNIIGAGSVLLEDTLACATYVGNPAKQLSSD